jgi:hypothetical protein
MGTTGDAPSDMPQDTGQAAPSKGKWPHLIKDLRRRLAGASAVAGPLGLLAVEEEERLAADRHLTTDEEA